ncbi:MAG: hypothetical protein ACE15D_19310 [Candidatus Eisenbacteria bacterium]
MQPNPIRNLGEISFALPRADDDVRIELFDSAGRRAAAIPLGSYPAGWTRVSWSPPADLPSGVYVLRLSGRSGEARGKVVVLRSSGATLVR